MPSTPDPALVTLVAALIRHALTLLSGAGILGGLVINDGALLTIAGSLVGLATVGWSIYQKVAAKKADHLASLLSARTGVAVSPIV